ncbi:conjugative transposon protein TraM [Betaproteobacteria bacterium]|nr:conjugative transposon protein TraM [Betaproteobacteria bacterium]
MNENESNEKKTAGAEKKELTPQQIQKRKKMLVYPLFFLVFAGAMWLIFAPSGKKGAEQADGFNPDIPLPVENGITANKRDAYEQEVQKNREQDKMRSLQDFSSMFEGTEQAEMEKQAERTTASPIESSASAYRDVNNQLGHWYDEPATEMDEQSQLALEFRIQELERKQEEENERKNSVDEQLAMVEKSYQIAAKYMPVGQPQADVSTTPAEMAPGKKAVAQPVSQVQHNVVSLLSAPMDDSVFVAQYSKPRNLGFNTVAGSETVMAKNSIRACVYKTATITDGQEIQLRTLEAIEAGGYRIPANAVISGTAKIGDERLDIVITSIQYAGNIIPVELLVYDMDGMRGISVPGSEELNAAKEMAANMGSSAGTSISISDNAGSQLAADLGKGLIQGASQYLNRKFRTVKVTLKANYRVLLLPPLQ